MLIAKDKVIVTSGPLTGFEGVVESVDATRVSLKLDFIGRNTTVQLKPHVLKFVARALSPETISSIQEISEEVMRHLSKRPEDLYALPSRRFEEVICELFQNFGYDAHLTPQTRDGGRDVLAVLSTPMQQFSF